MRVGQPVTVTADIYGGSVTYHGHVEGLGAGSGSAFALLPPQNASGNWIKIVQRVPVRIALDPKELRDHPLRVGLSVTVECRCARHSPAPLITTSVGAGTTRADTGEDIGARRRCPDRAHPGARMAAQRGERAGQARAHRRMPHDGRRRWRSPRWRWRWAPSCRCWIPPSPMSRCPPSPAIWASSTDQGTWVITSFAVANGIGVPLTGWLMGRYGVVRTFVVSVLAFTVASFLCGIAWSLPSLIFFRVLQGGVSGPDDPGSQALLISIFPPTSAAPRWASGPSPPWWRRSAARSWAAIFPTIITGAGFS